MLYVDTVEANRRQGMISARLGSQYASTDTNLGMAPIFGARSRELTPLELITQLSDSGAALMCPMTGSPSHPLLASVCG